MTTTATELQRRLQQMWQEATPENSPPQQIQNYETDVSSTDTDDIDWFEHISDADREYLLGPHKWPDPCRWCEKRLSHWPGCPVLIDDDLTKMPFGEHTGKSVRKIPTAYLRWLAGAAVTLDTDLRAEIERILHSKPRGS